MSAAHRPRMGARIWPARAPTIRLTWARLPPGSCAPCRLTRFGGPEVLDIVDLPDPVPADGQQLYDVRAAGDQFR